MSENIGDSSGVNTFVSHGQTYELVGGPPQPPTTTELITYTENFKPQPQVETLEGFGAGLVVGSLGLVAAGLCFLNNHKSRR